MWNFLDWSIQRYMICYETISIDSNQRAMITCVVEIYSVNMCVDIFIWIELKQDQCIFGAFICECKWYYFVFSVIYAYLNSVRPSSAYLNVIGQVWSILENPSRWLSVTITQSLGLKINCNKKSTCLKQSVI